MKLHEETDLIVIADDGQTAFWSTAGIGTGTISIPTLSDDANVKQKGTDSLKMVVGSGSYQAWDLYHEYASAQDWSGKKYVCLYWYGANTGATIRLIIVTGTAAGKDNTMYRLWNIVDNFSGWKRIVLSIDNYDEQGAGGFDLTYVWRIEIDSEASPDTQGTWYLDYLLVAKNITTVDLTDETVRPYVKTHPSRYSSKFIPGGTKRKVEFLGAEGHRVTINLFLTDKTKKDQLDAWHEAGDTLTFTDHEESFSVKITALNLETLLYTATLKQFKGSMTLLEV